MDLHRFQPSAPTGAPILDALCQLVCITRTLAPCQLGELPIIRANRLIYSEAKQAVHNKASQCWFGQIHYKCIGNSQLTPQNYEM